MIEEKPVKLNGRLQEIFAEDFKRELAEIRSPAARHLYMLAKAFHLAHLRFAEYAMLIAASDVTGHSGVGVLLESVLAGNSRFLSEIDASFDTSSKARSPSDWQLDSGCDHWQRPGWILESRKRAAVSF